MECTKLKRVLISSLLAGSIILPVATVSANTSNFRNATFCAQYNVKLDKDNTKLNQDEMLKPRGYKHEENFSKALNTLIERKVISKDKAEEIKAYISKQKEERKEAFDKFRNMTDEEKKEIHDKIKNMTEEEKNEFFDSHKKERKGIIEKMIEDGVITEEQGAELEKALTECKNKTN